MISMHLTSPATHIFPSEIEELLRPLDGIGFFDDAMVGSWVMPLYRELFGMSYALRTLDIDFAVKIVRGATSLRADVESVLIALGYLPSWYSAIFSGQLHSRIHRSPQKWRG